MSRSGKRAWQTSDSGIDFPDREIALAKRPCLLYLFPIGKTTARKHLDNPAALGEAIRARRKAVGLRQIDLATSANTSLRFVSEVERGKQTAQVGAVMRLLNALGLELELSER